MAILLTCSCGQEVPVQFSQAGSEIVCACGQAIEVPSLSKLRELSGKGAYEAGIVDTIHRMVGSGELPAGNQCAVSGEPTEDVIELFVEAERMYHGGDSTAKIALVAVLCSPLLALLMSLNLKSRPDVGRATTVATPLRVAVKYQRRVSRSGQRTLRRWLRTVPVYAQLLKEYPRARIVFQAPGELGRFKEGPDQKRKETRDLDFEF